MVKYDSELGESRQEKCSFSIFIKIEVRATGKNSIFTTFVKIGVRADRKIVALVPLLILE